jgi:hypothetical protein
MHITKHSQGGKGEAKRQGSESQGGAEELGKWRVVWAHRLGPALTATDCHHGAVGKSFLCTWSSGV